MRVMEVCGEGRFEMGWSEDLLSMHILVFSECCSVHAQYPFKRQAEEEKGRKWIWRLMEGIQLSQCLLCIVFFAFLSFLPSFPPSRV